MPPLPQIFAGKDASVGLGKSSVKPEHAYSEWEANLDEEEKGVLNDWVKYFTKVRGVVSAGMTREERGNVLMWMWMGSGGTEV